MPHSSLPLVIRSTDGTGISNKRKPISLLLFFADYRLCSRRMGGSLSSRKRRMGDKKGKEDFISKEKPAKYSEILKSPPCQSVFFSVGTTRFSKSDLFCQRNSLILDIHTYFASFSNTIFLRLIFSL